MESFASAANSAVAFPPARARGSLRAFLKNVVRTATVLLFFSSAAGSSAAQTPAKNLRLANLSEKLSRDLHTMAKTFDGVMGIYVKDLNSGQKFEVNSDVIFPQASSIKIPILVELMRQAQEGKIRLDERVVIHRAALVDGSGVLQFFADGQSSVSIHDLAVLMVVLSDNSATNMIIERIGMENVNSLLDSLGLRKTRLARKMIDLAAEKANRENRSTPAEMGELVEMIQSGKLLDAEHTRMALEILEYPKDSPVRAGVPDNVTVAEKPGSLNGAQCDTGIVFLQGRPYVLSVMTTYDGPAGGNPAITAVSRRVFSYFDRLRANSYGVRIAP